MIIDATKLMPKTDKQAWKLHFGIKLLNRAYRDGLEPLLNSIKYMEPASQIIAIFEPYRFDGIPKDKQEEVSQSIDEVLARWTEQGIDIYDQEYLKKRKQTKEDWAKLGAKLKSKSI